MNKVILGMATMNAGLSMPGSILTYLLDKVSSHFDSIIIVDGDLKESGRIRYSKWPNVKVIDNKWKGSLKEQYDLLLAHMNYGDWWFMLDDDELPSSSLLSILNNLRTNKSPGHFKSISTPRVTCFTENGVDYYDGESIPTPDTKGRPGFAGPRAHIFRIDPDMQVLCSKAGRHVVPYFTDPKASVYVMGDSDFCHYHFKAPELYVLNDCVKSILDRDIKDDTINREFQALMSKYGITDMESFIRETKQLGKKDLEEFCIAYKDRGAPEGRMFIWYYNILHPELNPYPAQDWTYSLKLVLNNQWRTTYVQSKSISQAIPRYHHKIDCVTPYPMGNGRIEV